MTVGATDLMLDEYVNVAHQQLSAGRRWSPRQAEILDGLQKVFLEDGFRHLTIGDLVERLRCSRRTLYSIAPSKEELVLIVVDRLFNHMGKQAYAEASACEDAGDAVAAYLNRSITTFRPVRAAFTEDVEAYMPTKQLYDRHLQIALDVLGDLVTSGIEDGSFRQFHAPLIAEILDACVDRIRRPDVLARAGTTWSQAIAEFSELIRNGLLVGRA